MPAPAIPREKPDPRANPLPEDFVCPNDEELEELEAERDEMIENRRDMNVQQRLWDPNLQRLLDVTNVLIKCGRDI